MPIHDLPKEITDNEEVGKAFTLIALLLFASQGTALVSETKVLCPDGKWRRYRFQITEEEI